jgi:hypothetical protein
MEKAVGTIGRIFTTEENFFFLSHLPLRHCEIKSE